MIRDTIFGISLEPGSLTGKLTRSVNRRRRKVLWVVPKVELSPQHWGGEWQVQMQRE